MAVQKITVPFLSVIVYINKSYKLLIGRQLNKTGKKDLKGNAKRHLDDQEAHKKDD